MKKSIEQSPHAEQINSLKFINPPGLYDPRPNAYSHLAVFPAGWCMILPAGQGGENAQGELPPGFAEQLRQALDNTEIVLAAAGARMSDVAKFNLLIVEYNEEKFDVVRKEFTRVWGDIKPAWTLIPVPALALEGMLVEIDVIAVVPQ